LAKGETASRSYRSGRNIVVPSAVARIVWEIISHSSSGAVCFLSGSGRETK